MGIGVSEQIEYFHVYTYCQLGFLGLFDSKCFFLNQSIG
jgi:hypothetical protein